MVRTSVVDKSRAFAGRMVRGSRAWAASRFATGLHKLFGASATDGFGVLMYHRVTEQPPAASPPTWNVTPQRFRAQLAGLLSRGYEAWPLRRTLAFHKERRAVPANVFVVTFDDGYENNYTAAWPILRELQIPATIFLATAFLDTKRPFAFDDWPHAGRDDVPASAWQPLTSAECDQMLESGLIDLGTHTHTHQSFLGRAEEFRVDLSTSIAVLRQRFGIQQPTFAFPFGRTSPELIEAARQVGTVCGLSTQGRRACASEDPFLWGRFHVENHDTPATLAAKLSGWFTPVDRALQALRRPIATLNGALYHVKDASASGASDAMHGGYATGQQLIACRPRDAAARRQTLL
jgi:peptidoglycan/xylan/chitin deacetylase (PgdA/CDA1 family)